MNDKIKSAIEKIIKKVYIYSIDNISFAKSLREIDYKSKSIKQLINTSEDLLNSLSYLPKDNDFVKIIAELENSLTFASSNLSLLQKIKCKDALLNEKSDLIIETFEILRIIEKTISQIK